MAEPQGVETVLDGDGWRDLLFAPEAGGHYLPWGVLFGAPFMFIPALPLLKRLLEHPAGAGNGALVVGNTLGDLPYVEAEAQKVAALWDVQPLVGPQATKGAVLGQLQATGPSSPLQVAHFATHAYFDPGDAAIFAARRIGKWPTLPPTPTSTPTRRWIRASSWPTASSPRARYWRTACAPPVPAPLRLPDRDGRDAGRR